MHILLISPVSHPIRPDSKYIGIERMVWSYANELIRDHQVTVMGHADSVFPEGVKLLPSQSPHIDFCAKEQIPQTYYDPELKQYQTYQYLLRTFDVIHDWSHLHLASRFNVNLPSLNIFFHAPALAQYPKSPYNIISFSEWGAREFKRVYRQEARYQQSIGIDPEVYFPSGKRGERFLTIGRMAPEKGNLTAIEVCMGMKVPLDVVGGRGLEKTGSDPLTDYEKAIRDKCDGEQIKFLGEVTEEEKIELMQSCRALIYATDHPEVTSHKLQEAMFCGAPVIAPALGAMPEIVTQGVDGYLCDRVDGYLWAIDNVDKLKPEQTHDAVVKKYSIKEVVKNYIPLYQEVAEGLRW